MSGISGIPLIDAAASGEVGRLGILLRDSSDEARESVAAHGTEAMLHAAFYGHVDAVKLLIEHGVPVEPRDASSGTPLSMAAGKGHVPIVQALLDAGADPNSRSARGSTPLMKAAVWGRMEVAKLLLKRGADPGALDLDGEPAWMYAADKGHDELAVLLGYTPEGQDPR
jgi:ankyrin repeat protein